MSTKRAIRLQLSAQRRRAIAPDYDPVRRQFELELADKMDAESEALLTPPKPLKRGLGAEIVPRMEDGLPGLGLTLTEPDLLSAEASQQRANLLERANALELGIETAQEIKASTSVEKMLAHQLAALHRRALTLLAQSESTRDPNVAVKQARAAARMADAASRAALTLQKLQSGGGQTIQVQYFHVNTTVGGVSENLQNSPLKNRGGRPPTSGDRTTKAVEERRQDRELLQRLASAASGL